MLYLERSIAAQLRWLYPTAPERADAWLEADRCGGAAPAGCGDRGGSSGSDGDLGGSRLLAEALAAGAVEGDPPAASSTAVGRGSAETTAPAGTVDALLSAAADTGFGSSTTSSTTTSSSSGGTVAVTAAAAAAATTTAAGAYGYTRPERRRLVERIAAAGAPNALLDKLHACLSLAGFDAAEAALLPRHRAALAMARRYVELRQGEVWRRIAAAFAAEGLRPSEEDRARVASEHSTQQQTLSGIGCLRACLSYVVTITHRSAE